MEPAVEEVLESVADEHEVCVLAARDVGSRAWNLADPASDTDVCVLFAQRPVEYATLDGYVATLEHTAGTYECRGWNVRRFAELLADSNPSAFEFLHSPRRYREFGPLAALEADVGNVFAPMALYHHYRSLATRQYRKYLQGRLLEGGDLAYLLLERDGDSWLAMPAGDGENEGDGPVRVPAGDYEEGAADRTVKRHLYVARAVLYAAFVRETHRFPPLDFPQFLEDVRDEPWVEPSFLERTRTLVERKRAGEGEAKVGLLFEPAEISLPEIDPADHAGRTVPRGRVDRFVREALGYYG
ncbi:nucleotidyltransferase domain-containing protein [Natronobiforma cellulositropha]|uniref:nucleotidyltransferase domain-containing protein n=1 Tax=Natronobiforma cellulositropha TaxID=1679076 RepID=UPI0021D5D227|nr:nucleotidyltransferase domain-containing protein [Natronobiforma cellulositropha]